MPQLEAAFAQNAATLIDISGVERPARAAMWRGAAVSAFPGLTLKMAQDIPAVGSISRVSLGAAELCNIESCPIEVISRPQNITAGPGLHISLMVLCKGSMQVSQRVSDCLLTAGDMCLVDEAGPFNLVGEDCCNILFLRLPRAAVLSRYPQLEKLFGVSLPSDEPGTGMLADMLLRLPEEAPKLAETQRSAMMGAIIQMLGVAGPFSALPETSDWRVHRALDFIELNLSVGGLTAEDVARDQRISRRRLDQIMSEALGESIASHLWSRRLEQAAADLRDPSRSGYSVAQTAYANGFEDAAHFTRAFKRRYLVTPGKWRLN